MKRRLCECGRPAVNGNECRDCRNERKLAEKDARELETHNRNVLLRAWVRANEHAFVDPT